MICKTETAIFALLSLAIAGICGPQTDPVELTIARISKVSRSWSASFSADGKEIAFISDLTGTPQAWIVAANGGWPRLLTGSAESITALRWSPDGKHLAYSGAQGGASNEQIYLIQPDGSALRRITDGGKEDNWLGAWSPDGQWLSFSSNRRDGNNMDVYVFEADQGKLQLAAKNEGTGWIPSMSRGGRYALLHRVLGRGNSNEYRINLNTHDEVLLTPHQGMANSYASIAPDGSAAYLATDRDTDLSAFARVGIRADGTAEPLKIVFSRPDAELQSVTVSPKGTKAALIWNAAGRTDLSFFDTQTSKMLPGPALPGEIADADDVQFSPDGRLLALTIYGAQSPPNIWILNLGTNKFHQATFSQHPGVDLTLFVRPELVRYKAADGLELSGWLYLPKNARKPVPMVVSFHGGPEGQEVPSFRSDYQGLLANGIGVLASNVRGSSGFGKKFMNADNGALRRNAILDIKSSVEYIVGAGIADAKRIGIMGGSYGGYMTMEGLTEFPELFAAGADLYGIVNFETFFEHTEGWMAAVSALEYGDPKTQKELLRELSPVHKLDRVKAPTLVLHGANDTNVPVVEAEQVVHALEARGVPVRFELFRDEGHGWSKIESRIRSNTLVVQWFVKYLRAADSGANRL